MKTDGRVILTNLYSFHDNSNHDPHSYENSLTILCALNLTTVFRVMIVWTGTEGVASL